MSLGERKKRILKAIIDEYIENAEPVGSKSIAQRSGLDLSPATIRNEMSDLEDMGFLEQPHVSAGRVPSHAGYRLYVNELMNRYRLTINEMDAINVGLRLRMQELDRLIRDAGRAVSRLTNYTSYAVVSSPSETCIRKFDLVFVDSRTVIVVLVTNSALVKNKYLKTSMSITEEQLAGLSRLFNDNFTDLTLDQIPLSLIKQAEETAGDLSPFVSAVIDFAAEVMTGATTNDVFVGGASRILSHPEYQDPAKAQKLLDYLSEKRDIIHVQASENESGIINITIGPENQAEPLQDASIVYATYGINDQVKGVIGVVGPTRMDYAKVAANLNYFIQGLNKLLRTTFLGDSEEK